MCRLTGQTGGLNWRRTLVRVALSLTLLLSVGLVSGEEATASSGADATTGATDKEPIQQQAPPKVVEGEKDTFNAKDHTDWGTYYDPKNIFCGSYDCYQILGFDYENYGREKPTTKTITKRYRALSREWHPDKSKRKDAKERFVKIARAYEVLTDVQTRKEYDFMRYNQEAYFRKYGASVLFHYAPQTDMVLVLLLLLAVANWFSWAAQKQRWQQVANRLVQATVEDWSPSQGGTNESKQLREQALEQLKTAEENEANSKEAPSKSKKGPKVSGRDKKKQEQEKLRPIISGLVDEMHNFGAGFHKPTWKDLLIVRMTVHWPKALVSGTVWQLGYYLRRLKGSELNDNERQVLTERAVGPVVWELGSPEDKEDMVKRVLWRMENLVEWKEEQEVKTWSRADQKMHAKMKKKSSNKEE